jgi:integrase
MQFQSTGMISRQRYRKITPLSKSFQALQSRYLLWRLEEKSLSNETMRKTRFETWRFLLFLEDNGVNSISKVNAKHIVAYFRQGRGVYSSETMGTRAYNLRQFFRFLVEKEFVDFSIQAAIPKIKFVGRRRIPEVWSKADIRKLLKAIDRGSPIGKRDYAICLLVIRFGMRVGDIRTLRIEHVDWNKAIMSMHQQKTGNPLQLPLTEEVGDALIDYLKNGRPPSTHREIFLLHCAPFSPFGERNNLSTIITKYRNAAGIILPKEFRKGFHSLRHNIATRLHEAEVPLPVIASFLGHVSIDSARHYAKANIKMLRKAALEWKEENDE